MTTTNEVSPYELKGSIDAAQMLGNKTLILAPPLWLDDNQPASTATRTRRLMASIACLLRGECGALGMYIA